MKSKTMSKIIKFYRHGETEWNKIGRLQGWDDSPLTSAGKMTAQAVSWQPDIVFCSDLPRAFETAKRMFPKNIIHQDARLREIYLGHWQGQYISELKQTEAYQCYVSSPQNFQATTQETFEQVTERMQNFISELEQLLDKKIAVVSHGVAIACLSVAYNNRSLKDLWKFMLAGGECMEFTLKADKIQGF